MLRPSIALRCLQTMGTNFVVIVWLLFLLTLSSSHLDADLNLKAGIEEVLGMDAHRGLSSTPSTYFDSSFSTIATSLTAQNSIFSADMDGDGDMDIVASFWTSDSIVSEKIVLSSWATYISSHIVRNYPVFCNQY